MTSLGSAAPKKPLVFISSTISDFRDLRSAIGYWLEELDFEVQCSELSDFGHRPSSSAFEVARGTRVAEILGPEAMAGLTSGKSLNEVGRSLNKGQVDRLMQLFREGGLQPPSIDSENVS